jgi:hypothetical protein
MLLVDAEFVKAFFETVPSFKLPDPFMNPSPVKPTKISSISILIWDGKVILT